MNETSKSLALPHRARIWQLCQGRGLDIGSGPDPLKLPNAEIHTWDQMTGTTFTGDAQYLQCLPDDGYDFVHASHVLEHMRDVTIALSNWSRVVRSGGRLVITVPDHAFYERGIWPSPFNSDHKQRFSVGPLPDEPNCWTIGRMVQMASSTGLALEDCWLELANFDFAQHASKFLVDQTMADATAQLCYVFRKL